MHRFSTEKMPNFDAGELQGITSRDSNVLTGYDIPALSKSINDNLIAPVIKLIRTSDGILLNGLQSTNTEINNISNRMNSVESSTGSMERQFDMLSNQFTIIEDKFNNIEGTEIGDLKNSVANLTTQQGELSSKVTEVETKTDNLAEKHTALEDKVNGIQGTDLTDLKTAVTNLTTQQGVLTSKVTKVENKTGDLTNKHNALDRDVNGVKGVNIKRYHFTADAIRLEQFQFKRWQTAIAGVEAGDIFILQPQQYDFNTTHHLLFCAEWYAGTNVIMTMKSVVNGGMNIPRQKLILTVIKAPVGLHSDLPITYSELEELPVEDVTPVVLEEIT